MRFIQTRAERTAAVAASAETHQLGRIIDIRFTLVISLLQCRDIDQKFSRRRLAGKWMYRHLLSIPFYFFSCPFTLNDQLERYHKLDNLEWLPRADFGNLGSSGVPPRTNTC